MSSRILVADRGLEWHRAVAPGVEVGEITAHGRALSRPRPGFESRWGHDQSGRVQDSAEIRRRIHAGVRAGPLTRRQGRGIAPPAPRTRAGPDERFSRVRLHYSV